MNGQQRIRARFDLQSRPCTQARFIVVKCAGHETAAADLEQWKVDGRLREIGALQNLRQARADAQSRKRIVLVSLVGGLQRVHSVAKSLSEQAVQDDVGNAVFEIRVQRGEYTAVLRSP